MSMVMTRSTADNDSFTGGLAGAVILHVALGGVLVLTALFVHVHHHAWGSEISSSGAIQASLVSALPLPQKAPPVEKAVLASENVSPAPAPVPKEKAAPPPKPTDVLIKAKTPEKPVTKEAPKPAPEPPRHPQPTPETPKAASGEAATQLPSSVAKTLNGTAAATVQDKAFGSRYAYYRDIVSRTVAKNWYTAEVDPRSAHGKHVVLLMDILRDGTPSNVHIETPSGATSLDTSAIRAVQRVETFGPLPAGDHVTVELSFEYHEP